MNQRSESFPIDMLATKEEMRALGLALKGISYHVCEAIHWNELIDLIGSSIRSLPSKVCFHLATSSSSRRDVVHRMPTK